MFRKLRNKLILINLGITSAVILIAFTTIYIISTNVAKNRPLEPEEFFMQSEELLNNDFSDDMERIITWTIREEKNAAARDLLTVLIFSGIAIEIAVALASYYMAEQAIKPVREAYESQKVFIANASHEIKTPLAAISANLEAADIRNNKWIKNVELETAKLTTLNSELLTLARTDLVTNVSQEEANLKKMIIKELETLESRLKNIRLTTKINLPEKIKINSTDFLQIFGILMDNAIKYCDKKIKIELTEHKLEITNDGNKIPQEKLQHIFERFYQVDKSSDGVGLGLSIAKSLADRNHWNLTAKSDKTTCFTLSF